MPPVNLSPQDKPAPSPWLTWVVAVALSVGTTLATSSFSAGEKSAELRQTREQLLELQQEVVTLKSRANGTDLVVVRMEEQLKYIRAGLDELKQLLQGKGPRYVRGE